MSEKTTNNGSAEHRRRERVTNPPPAVSGGMQIRENPASVGPTELAIIDLVPTARPKLTGAPPAGGTAKVAGLKAVTRSPAADLGRSVNVTRPNRRATYMEAACEGRLDRVLYRHDETLISQQLANLPAVTPPGAVTGAGLGATRFLILNPDTDRAEIVECTAHGRRSTSAFVCRGQLGTKARDHWAGTLWRAIDTPERLS